MAAVKLHENATFYAYALHWIKSLYGKSQPVIGGKLFSFSQEGQWTSTGSSKLDYSGKNPKRMQNFQELIKNNLEYPWETKKNSCEISSGLGFWPWNLPNFQGWSFVLPEISRNTEKNQNNSRVFFQKRYVFNSPLPSLVFLSGIAHGIAHSKTVYLNWSYGGTFPERSIDHMSR